MNTGEATRTPDLRIMRPLVGQDLNLKGETGSSRINQRFSPPIPTDTCKMNPDLAQINAAWNSLPEALKAGIVAMVKAASGKHRP